MTGLFACGTHKGYRSNNRRTEKEKERERKASSETSLHFPSCVCEYVPEGDGREMSPVVRKLQSDLSPVSFMIPFQQVTKYRCSFDS